MPHYYFDEEVLLEYREPEELEQYDRAEDGSLHTYESTSGEFSPEDFEEEVRIAYEFLCDLGTTSVRCRYDGGNDEDFAYFIEATVDGEVIGVDKLAARFAGGPLGRTRYIQYPDSMPVSPLQRAKDALDWLAEELAISMLGEGYGTGEFSIRGNFTADFITGEITDTESIP